MSCQCRALSKHFCWPPFFMKDWVLSPQNVECCIKPPLWGPRDNAPESFGYFIDPRFSNRLSMHHSVTYSFPFLGLFCMRKICMVTSSPHHHTWGCVNYSISVSNLLLLFCLHWYKFKRHVTSRLWRGLWRKHVWTNQNL